MLPEAFLYFRAREDEGGELEVFTESLNSLLDKPGNMLLLKRALLLETSEPGAYLLVVPLFLGFPWLLWPFVLLPRVIYSLSLIVRARRQGARLKPISARSASAELYEVLLNES